MEQRVFRIDQECFIIFAESMSSKKERFLRVGNSDFLKDFGESLTFLTLVTPIYPGNPFKEIEIFRPDIDRRLIGLQSVVEKFMVFLQNGNVDTEKLETVFAESQGDTGKVRKTEREFLESIKRDNRRKNHSFASFYNDGNIRIFNRNEDIFDLKKYLSTIRDERKELEQMADFFKQSYYDCYQQSGFIISGKSLFVFSGGRFTCFSDSAQWVREAIRVGINPASVEFLYLTRGIEPDSLWLKTFLKKWNDEQKIKLVLRDDKPNWLHLIPDELYIPLYPEKDSIDNHMGGVRMLVQNKRITILFDQMKLVFQGEAGFLDKGSIIEGEMIPKKKKVHFSLVIEEIRDRDLTVYACNPVIFKKKSLSTKSVKEFWDGYPYDLPERITNKIYDHDKEYVNDYVPPFSKDPDFMARLFVETVRRIHWEGIKKQSSTNTYIHFARILEGFDGKLINQHRIIMEQHLGLCNARRSVGIRNVLAQHSIPDIDEDDNPFLFFQKEYSLEEIKQKQDAFKAVEKREKNSGDLLASIESRFSDIIDDKLFFEEERIKLKEFIEEIETQERLNTVLLEKEESNETLLDTNGEKLDTDIPADDAISSEEAGALTHQLHNEDDSNSNEKPGNRRLWLIVVAMVVLAMLLIFGGILFLRPDILQPVWNFIESRNDQVSQQDYLEGLDDKYTPDIDSAMSTSRYYQFYMTLMDTVRLTNMICEKNGFHQLATDWEKAYRDDLEGMDPDWIYPGNLLTMPDGTTVRVRSGHTLWGICEEYLLKQINRHELVIRDIIIQVKQKKISTRTAKKEFSKLESESHSEMVKDVLVILVKQDNFKEWEPYLKKYKK